MLNPMLDRAIRFGERHERAIALLSGIWFVISCASWIPQVPVPEVPYVTDRDSWMLSGAWNAVWWGFAHPALDKRRKQLAEGQASANAYLEDGKPDEPRP